MSRLSLSVIALCVSAQVGAAQSVPGSWKLPLIEGKLEGDWSDVFSPGGPSLHWSITSTAPRPRERAMSLVVNGPGVKIRAEATLDPLGNGAWELREAELDLAQWWSLAAALAGSTWDGIGAGGTLSAHGAGMLLGGVPAGRVQLAWRNGRIDDLAHKLVIEGITADVIFEDVAARRTAPAQTIAWTGGRYDLVELGVGRALIALDGDQLRLEDVQVAVFGGDVRLSAVKVSLSRPDVEMTVQIFGVDAALVLPLFPEIATSASGRLDGSLSLRRDDQGLHLGPGRLTLPPGGTADVRLKPTPGLLTASLPDSVRKHYPGLADLEAGRVPMRAELLEVVFDPAGDAEGRTARVRLVGGPVDPRMRAPIDLNVNIRGPLETVVQFGTNSRLQWGGGNKR